MASVRARPRTWRLKRDLFIGTDSWQVAVMCTWRLSIISEVRNEDRLRIDDHYVVGCDAMHPAEGAHLVRAREIEVSRDRDIAEVHRKLVTPNGEPFDVAQGLALRQRERDIFAAVALDDTSAASLVPQTERSLVSRSL